MTLAIIIFIALALYVLSCCVAKRVPTMLSEVYYLADKDWLFPALMATLGASFLPLMLSKGGLECMAFLTCVGIIFVGAAPAYLDESERTIHKCGAITSAIASVAWACSISALPTVRRARCCALHLEAPLLAVHRRVLRDTQHRNNIIYLNL